MSAGSNRFKIVSLVILITLLWNKAYIMGILCKRIINKPGLGKRFCTPADFCNSMIETLCYHSVPGIHDFFLSLLGKCEHHNAACIAVQAVNNIRLMF